MRDGGRADIKEVFVQASSRRIRAREQWTLRTLKGELNAYGAELYLQGSLPSTFFIFIINYFSLIARIIKRGSGKGRCGSPESWTRVCLRRWVRA